MSMQESYRPICQIIVAIIIMIANTQPTLAGKFITVTAGGGGQMEPRQLYSVEILCTDAKKINLTALRNMVDGIHSRVL